MEKETYSKPMSLGGLSDTVNSDQDIIETLEKKEQEDKTDQAQQEIFKLMTSNREKTQYKNALAATIKEIKEGASVKKGAGDGKE